MSEDLVRRASEVETKRSALNDSLVRNWGMPVERGAPGKQHTHTQTHILKKYNIMLILHFPCCSRIFFLDVLDPKGKKTDMVTGRYNSSEVAVKTLKEVFLSRCYPLCSVIFNGKMRNVGLCPFSNFDQ